MSKFLTLAFIGLVAFSLFRGGKGKSSVPFPNAVISEATPVQEVPAENRIRVVLFTGTEWCPACQHLDRSVIKTERWREFAANEILFEVFDIPADRSAVTDEARTMMNQYNIRAFPTMLVLDRQNEILSQQVGSGPPVENYKKWIRDHASFY
ncbi:MAG: thioredoxin family protein [Verrucomicrobiae bacterium]|nr:thioredoxin family protein [Verrucomicrobiae bacterium]MCP5550410.1 thioredoxin family protein [Akkermansiaceae bacterium]